MTGCSPMDLSRSVTSVSSFIESETKTGNAGVLLYGKDLWISWAWRARQIHEDASLCSCTSGSEVL